MAETKRPPSNKRRVSCLGTNGNVHDRRRAMKKSVTVSLAAVAMIVAFAGTVHAQHGHGGGHGGGFHGGGFNGGGHGHVIVGIGPGWWGPYPYWYPYWYPPPYYAPPYYGYGYPSAPADEPSEYAQQQSERQPQYWYYCPSSKAYYPKVHDCPEEWLRVLPRDSED